MPILKMIANDASNEGEVTEVVTLVGHFTATVAETTAGEDWNGVIVFELKADDGWIVSETFDDAGVFPGFNGITGEYRLRLSTKQTTGSAKIIFNGYDKPTNIQPSHH